MNLNTSGTCCLPMLKRTQAYHSDL